MFIYNIKINGSKTFKYIFSFIVILIIIVMLVVTYKIFNGAISNREISSCMPQSDVSKIATKNYTNVLKTVHENIDTYVGKKICFVGYVYRVLDLKENQFVLARDMIVSSDFQTVVVGFLCHSEIASNFENGTWVEIEGTITKGNYYGDMPIIEIEKINTVQEPTDEYVYPPDDSFVTTSTVI